MHFPRPRFVLIAETTPIGDATPSAWRFALHGLDTSDSVVANDSEEGACEERLSLLAVVRGLEALDQPSDVTLVTSSVAVRRGIQQGLDQWRNNHWRWERFGRLTPVRNADLWRRIDQALAFHEVHCQGCRTQQPGPVAATPASSASRFVDGLDGSPTVVVVPKGRSRRTIRFTRDQEAMPLHAAAG